MLSHERMAHWRATRGYVEDVAHAIALGATEPRAAGRIYNVGEPDTLTELEWAERIARAMDWDGTFSVQPDDAMPAHLRAPGNTAQHWVADTSRIRDELGFRESIDREAAIRRTVDWERHTPRMGCSHTIQLRRRRRGFAGLTSPRYPQPWPLGGEMVKAKRPSGLLP